MIVFGTVIFFSGWDVLLRTVVIGVLAYAGLVLLLRIYGKRILSKMNSFELVVTVALGSTLASALTSSNVALLQALLAFAVLITMQFLVAWIGTKSTKFHKFITAEPTLVMYQGKFLHHMMDKERLTENELRSTLRSHGVTNIDNVEAVVLEVNGEFSVLENKPQKGGKATTLNGVVGYPPQSNSNSNSQSSSGSQSNESSQSNSNANTSSH